MGWPTVFTLNMYITNIFSSNLEYSVLTTSYSNYLLIAQFCIFYNYETLTADTLYLNSVML